MPHPTDVHVGQRAREARVAKGMTQTDLGDALGLSFQQVQKYEKGTNRTAYSAIGAMPYWVISRRSFKSSQVSSISVSAALTSA